jgi:hypothetical protein
MFVAPVRHGSVSGDGPPFPNPVLVAGYRGFFAGCVREVTSGA